MALTAATHRYAPDDDATVVSLALTTTLVTLPRCPAAALSCWLAASRELAMRSRFERRSRIDGQAKLLCHNAPLRLWRHDPAGTSHTRTCASVHPVTRVAPSDVRARHVTLPSCPRSSVVLTDPVGSRVCTWAVQSRLPVTMLWSPNHSIVVTCSKHLGLREFKKQHLQTSPAAVH